MHGTFLDRNWAFLTWAASEMSKMTNSLLDAISKTSPRVPSCSLKPQARASASEGDPPLRPIATLMSQPASSSDSRRFCAWAGACTAAVSSRLHAKTAR